MWCELINIIDATKAARHRELLQAKENKQENRFHLLANRTTFGIATSKWGSYRFCFVFVFYKHFMKPIVANSLCFALVFLRVYLHYLPVLKAHHVNEFPPACD